MTKLVVVGGNAAGMSAASKAKRRNPELEVTVLEAGPHISYSSCGIPYLVEGVVEDVDQLMVLTPEEAGERGLDVKTNASAVAFNPYTKEVVFESGKTRDSMHYDKLLIATGTRPNNPFPGGDLPGVFSIRRLDDAQKLSKHLEGSKGKRVAIVGGGYVGLEMAGAFQARGAKVSLHQKGPRLLSRMDADITDGLEEWLGKAGLNVHLDAKVEGFAAAKGGLTLQGDPGGDADTVIVAAGVKPCTDFAIKAGVQSTKDGHLLVDDQMRTNFHDVWAAGDCVAPRHILTGKPTPLALALPSNRMGRVAGDSIAASTENIPGPSLFFPGVLGTLIARVYGLGFAQTGLTQKMAVEEGFDVATSLIEAKSKAGYMPDAGDMAVKVVADRSNGKLLGVQLAGPEEAALRINAAAVALQAGFTVKKLAEAETAYAPPFSTVWDPLIVAAAECAKDVKK